MSGWQAIVFDLDDTLYPERDYVLSGMRAVAAWAEHELGVPKRRGFAELKRLFESGARGDTFDRWLAAHGLDATDRVEAMVEVYRGHAPQIAPYAGARELLDRLSRHARLGLVTDGYLAVQRRKVAALGLAGCLHAIVYSDALGRDAWKPSYRPFRRVLEELGVAPQQAVYVGDNPRKDFRGPRRLSMATIRVRHGDGLYRDLQPPSIEDMPDYEVGGLAGLDDLMHGKDVEWDHRTRTS